MSRPLSESSRRAIAERTGVHPNTVRNVEAQAITRLAQSVDAPSPNTGAAYLGGRVRRVCRRCRQPGHQKRTCMVHMAVQRLTDPSRWRYEPVTIYMDQALREKFDGFVAELTEKGFAKATRSTVVRAALEAVNTFDLVRVLVRRAQ